MLVATGKDSSAALRRLAYRAGQFARALVPAVPAADRALAAAYLSDPQLAAFARMAPADQRHAARVARLLLGGDGSDADLLVAALLHDLGKVAEGGRGRVRLPHRVAKVALARAAPALWARLGRRPHRGPLHGCYLLQQHPALGAAWAARLGVASRACALIAAHQEGEVPADLRAALLRLRRADDRA